MFLDEISIQTSILIYTGLGFVFFIGLGYYFFRNPIRNDHSVFWKSVLGSLRGLILVSLLVSILPFKFFEKGSGKESIDYIFVVDFPNVSSKEFNNTFRKADSALKIKFPDLEWVDFNGQKVVDFKKSASFSRSLHRLQKTIRRLSEGHKNVEVFILTDGNLSDLNTEWNVRTHLIAFGEIFGKEQIEFSTPKSTVYSVPDEEILMPIDVWLRNFKQSKNIFIDVFIDGKFYKKEKISFDQDHTYLQKDISLKSNKLGKHKIKLSLSNGLSALMVWNVVNEKALVYGFSDALNPEVGVLNRVAKNKFIKLIWNFDLRTKLPIEANNYIFIHISPDETNKRQFINGSTLFIYEEKDKIGSNLLQNWKGRHLKIIGESLWDKQMKEFQLLGTYAQTDSTIGSWLDDLFIQNNQSLDSLNKDLSQVDDLFMQDIPQNEVGRNIPKLNFMESKSNVDLLELDDLPKTNFSQEFNSNDLGESKFIWQNLYFKLWVILLILAEWMIRKFKELR